MPGPQSDKYIEFGDRYEPRLTYDGHFCGPDSWLSPGFHGLENLVGDILRFNDSTGALEIKTRAGVIHTLEDYKWQSDPEARHLPRRLCLDEGNNGTWRIATKPNVTEYGGFETGKIAFFSSCESPELQIHNRQAVLVFDEDGLFVTSPEILYIRKADGRKVFMGRRHFLHRLQPPAPVPSPSPEPTPAPEPPPTPTPTPEPTPTPVKPQPIRGAVIIVGSLFWQDHGDKLGDNVRRNWRGATLEMRRAIKVKLPIGYGRQSGKPGNKLYTMTLRPSYAQAGEGSSEQTEVGQGWLVPLRGEFADVNSVVDAALNLSRAEGTFAPIPEGADIPREKRRPVLANSWCLMALSLNPAPAGLTDDPARSNLRAEMANYWAELVNANISGDNDQEQAYGAENEDEDTDEDMLSLGEDGEDDGPGILDYNEFWGSESPSDTSFDEQGQLTLAKKGEHTPEGQWFTAVDPAEQVQLKQYDFAFCTVTRPRTTLPHPEHLAANLSHDYARRYFLRNRANGIITALDQQAIEALRKRKSGDSDTVLYYNCLLTEGVGELLSPDGKSSLKLKNGALVVETYNSQTGKMELSWSSTYITGSDKTGRYATLLPNGNFVLWSAKPDATMSLTEDSADIVWQSKTGRPSAEPACIEMHNKMPLFRIMRGTRVEWFGQPIDSQSTR